MVRLNLHKLEQQMQCVLGRTLPQIAHELANHTNGVLGYAELLQTPPHPSKAGEYAQKLNENGERMLKLVRVLRSFNAADLHEPGVRTLLSDWAAGLETLLHGLARRRHVTLQVRMTPEWSRASVPLPLRFIALLGADAALRSECVSGKALRLSCMEQTGRIPCGGLELPESELNMQLSEAKAHWAAWGGHLVALESGGIVTLAFLLPRSILEFQAP